MVTKTYGSTLATIRSACLFFSVFALILACVFYFFDRIHSSLIEKVVYSSLWGIAIATIPLAAILPTCLFSIQVSDRAISHYLLGARISQGLLDQLVSIDIARGFGAVFKFAGGSKIRFIGAELTQLREMCRYIESLRPGQVAIRMSAAAGHLLATSDAFRKRDA